MLDDEIKELLKLRDDWIEASNLVSMDHGKLPGILECSDVINGIHRSKRNFAKTLRWIALQKTEFLIAALVLEGELDLVWLKGEDEPRLRVIKKILDHEAPATDAGTDGGH